MLPLGLQSWRQRRADTLTADKGGEAKAMEASDDYAMVAKMEAMVVVSLEYGDHENSHPHMSSATFRVASRRDWTQACLQQDARTSCPQPRAKLALVVHSVVATGRACYQLAKLHICDL